jgi:DUF4097 and DUF4098 domain-containing protein YvlB
MTNSRGTIFRYKVSCGRGEIQGSQKENVTNGESSFHASENTDGAMRAHNGDIFIKIIFEESTESAWK